MTEPTHILIVDDNEQGRYLLEALLQGHGFAVTPTANGAQALEAARRQPPDLIISDILMPVMDGFALCRAWMQDERLQAIPFVFYSATYTDPDDEALALSLGAARYIAKPAELEAFLRQIREVLEDYRAGRLQPHPPRIEEETVYYKEYNEILVRKLEDKVTELEAANARLHTLHLLDEAILSGQPMERIAQLALERLHEQVFFQRASIVRYDFAAGTARVLATWGYHGDDFQPGRVTPLERFASLERVRRGETRWIEDTATLADRSPVARMLYEQGVRSGMNIPLKVGEEVIGAFNIGAETPHAFSPEQRRQAQEVADAIAIALHNARLFKQVKRSEARYRNIFDGVRDAILVESPDGRILDVNESACRMFGYSREEFLTKTVDDLVASEGEKVLLDVRADEALPAQPVETVNLRANGETFLVELTGRMYHLGDQEVMLVVLRDISERKHHQRQLEAQAMLAQALGETLELEPLLERLLEAARHAIPAAEKGSLLLLESDGSLRIRALSGYSDPRLNGMLFPDDSGYAARTARQRQPLLIADARADPSIRYDGEIEEMRQIHSAITVPLLIQERLIGVLNLDATRKAAFTPEDLERLSHFAATAALVIENARLFEETRRRAEELTALYESSQALVTSTTLEEALQAIAQSVYHLFGCTGAGLYLYDPRTQTLEVKLATHPSIPLGTRLALGEGLAGKVAQTRRTMRIDDYTHWEGRSARYEGVPVRATMEAPLLYQNALVGVLVVHETGDSRRKFTKAEENLLELFAAQAAAVVQNAYLLENAQQRLHELEILQSLSADLRQAHDVKEMLPIFIQGAIRAVDAQAGSIYLWEDSRRGWISHGWLDASGRWLTDTAEQRHRAGEGITGWVGEHGEAYITADWREDDIVLPLPGEADLLQELTSSISLPLKAGETVIGVMHLWYAEQHNFSEAEKRLLTAITDMAGNALRRIQLHAQTRQQLRRLVALRDVDRAIVSSFDLSVVFDLLLGSALPHLKADAANVLLFDPVTHILHRVAGRGFLTTLQSQLKLRLGESLAGRAALERKLIAIPDLEATGERFEKPEFLAGENFKAYFALPLVAKGALKGVMEVFYRRPFSPSPDWLDFFETLAGQAAIAIDNITLFNELQDSNVMLTYAYDATIEGWARALELRDMETTDHSRRVVDLTLRIARQMGFSEAELIHIQRGALLHDIGKMGVPDAILRKPGPLSEEEWAIMRKHPTYAYELLVSIEYLRPALEIPHCHHEKWDGSGYPQGLKGEEIPLPARIFAVVDVWDALSSDRPYRKAWPREKIITYLQEQAGKHFDPRVVEVFLAVISEVDKRYL